MAKDRKMVEFGSPAHHAIMDLDFSSLIKAGEVGSGDLVVQWCIKRQWSTVEARRA